MPDAPSAPVPKTRSLSTPLVHHPPLRKGDTHHLVSLTSTTYGSLIIVDRYPDTGDSVDTTLNGQEDLTRRSQSLPNVADLDPSSPDSVINTWELMEGLDDDDPGNPSMLNLSNNYSSINFRSNNYSDNGASVKKLTDSYVFVEKPQEIVEELSSNTVSNSKPLWQLLSEESLISKMDPNVASSYQRALSSRQLGYNRSRIHINSVSSSPFISSSSEKSSSSPSTSDKLCSKSSPPIPTLSTGDKVVLPGSGDKTVLPDCEDKIVLPDSEDKIVLYFTSLRGIRRTYEDCCAVRIILKGFRVLVDERDISMDSTYRKELQSALGGKALSLPQLFIRGRHIGSVDEIKQLHEDGELYKLLSGFPATDSGFACESCGDARFLPCPNCNGSRKVFLEEEGQMRRCPDCNENGLIRCPACCS